MSAEDELRQASDQFYAALTRMLGGTSGAMDGLWAHDAEVTTMHPIGGREVGWEQVRASFDQVAPLCSGGQVRLKDPLRRVMGDVAYEMGTESGQATMAGESVTLGHRVTNIYRREGGAWKLVHHHGDIMPALVDLVSRLQTANAS